MFDYNNNNFRKTSFTRFLRFWFDRFWFDRFFHFRCFWCFWVFCNRWRWLLWSRDWRWNVGKLGMTFSCKSHNMHRKDLNCAVARVCRVCDLIIRGQAIVSTCSYQVPVLKTLSNGDKPLSLHAETWVPVHKTLSNRDKSLSLHAVTRAVCIRPHHMRTSH